MSFPSRRIKATRGQHPPPPLFFSSRQPRFGPSFPLHVESKTKHISSHRKSTKARESGHETKAQAETRKQTRTPYPPLMLLDMPTLHPDFVPLATGPPRLRHLLALDAPLVIPALLPILGFIARLVPALAPTALPTGLVVRRVLRRRGLYPRRALPCGRLTAADIDLSRRGARGRRAGLGHGGRRGCARAAALDRDTSAAGRILLVSAPLRDRAAAPQAVESLAILPHLDGAVFGARRVELSVGRECDGPDGPVVALVRFWDGQFCAQ